MHKEKDKHKRSDKRMLWRIHHWAGLYSGILIGLLSLTGALAVFIPEIDALILKQHYNASSSAAAGDPQFGKSVDSLTSMFPAFSSLSIQLPDKPGQVAEIDLVERSPEGRVLRYNFFVDAGADRVVGQRNHQNSLANYLRQMHVRLYEGNWGRQLVGIGGLALVVLAVTGLLIYGNFMKKQSWPNVRKQANTRIVMADWHKLLGISALAFNLVIALTGAWLGLQPWLMRWLDITTPNAYKAPVIMEPEADKAMEIDWHEALAAVSKEFPELKPHYLAPSTNGSGAIVVSGNIKGTVYERNINKLILSKSGYTPLFKYDVREKPFSHKLFFVQEALHFGDFGGLMLKVVYAILGLASGFLSISGFVIYLYRRKKKQPEVNPLKLTFVYSMASVMFLVVIALISLFIGYAQAASLAAILINAILIGLPLYALARYIIRGHRNKKIQTVLR
ncbi:MAG TPA: PepSY-associated TM helix domain-containing protein [Cyclobacteriaceae bacterium]|nr:PepSY-associated TM helix domain-containing protein [Cyclobacteriaceae bacterium]